MTIYLDMDGVIADFFGGLAKFYNVDHWKKIPDKEASIMALKGTRFFYDLETFETSNTLVEYVKKISHEKNIDWGICSSPLRGDRDNSAYWKRCWLAKHEFMPRVENLIFTGMKEKFATNHLDGSPNILIDDKPTNIRNWNLKGGIGILYQANENDLEEELFVELNQVLEYHK